MVLPNVIGYVGACSSTFRSCVNFIRNETENEWISRKLLMQQNMPKIQLMVLPGIVVLLKVVTVYFTAVLISFEIGLKTGPKWVDFMKVMIGAKCNENTTDGPPRHRRSCGACSG